MQVYEALNNLGIVYEKHDHIPVYTIEQASQLDLDLQGRHCKNLFIRDRSGMKHYLVIVEDSKKVDFKKLAEQINSTKLSFASEERLFQYLGLKPGAVSPFGLINDNKKVEVLIDEDLKNYQEIGFHPNINTVTLILSYFDFERFLKWCGNKVAYVKL